MNSTKHKQQLICLVSNDLATDNRMHKICNSLANANYSVELLGRRFSDSLPINKQQFLPTRLQCVFNKGVLFYLELNIRFFIYLLLNPFDIVCACDADTLLAAYLASSLKRKKLVFDAHEYYSQSPELIGRTTKQKIWQQVENSLIPKTHIAYTVNESLAKLFENKFKKKFHVIKNTPKQYKQLEPKQKQTTYIIYQGAINLGRGIKESVIAMKYIDAMPLYILGDGDELPQIQQLIKDNQLEKKVFLLGKKSPKELQQLTYNAYIGLNLLENRGLSYYYSLNNKFFDYIQAHVPQLCIAFPEYISYNNKYQIAIMTENIDSMTISTQINYLIKDKELYQQLQDNCRKAALELCWEQEEQHLISLYNSLNNI